MTEAEWLACTDPDPMLECIKSKWGDRKLRLFACACCRHIWELLSDERCRKAVEISELAADGIANTRQLRAASQAANRAWLKLRTIMDRSVLIEPTNQAVHDAVAPAYYGSICAHALTLARPLKFVSHSTACAILAVENVINGTHDTVERERATHRHFLRDIFGNPFRQIIFSPNWRTDTAVSLARQMYESREFSAMPILADALQDAGCDNEDILTHCRDVTLPHVRGCWVVDHILGKS